MILPVAKAPLARATAGAAVAPRAHAPRGMTLVEMLVAMTLTLLLMGAVAQIFGMLGQGVNGSRSMAELNDRLRAAGYRLRQDLGGITVDPTPPVRPELNSGYLEIIEGPESDQITYLSGARFDKWNGAVVSGKWVGDPNPYAAVVGSDDRLVGDIDDVLLFTTRSSGEMFSGRADATSTNIEGSSVRSPYAEVMWFCRPTANTSDPRTFTLYRRQRIVTAQPGTPPFVDTSTGPPSSRNTFGGDPNTIPFTTWSALYALTDVSIRRQGSDAMPNSLGDLTRRENRYLHNGTVLAEFPHPFYAFDPVNHTFDNNTKRFGEDIILTNVLAFDVRVWDPDVQVRAVAAPSSASVSAYAVQPGDPGYAAGVVPALTTAVKGCYVDLGIDFGSPSTFAGKGYPIPGNPVPAKQFTYPTYDTWSTAYENNGVDDDGDGTIDDGANGKDDNTNGAIDEAEERETAPPYATPLTGIQVRLRVYEPSSRQIRQITILQSF
jgi:prepilin-type N-terminal cleavage/methylation domain-containing protein